MIESALRSKLLLSLSACAALAGCGGDGSSAAEGSENKAELQAMSSAYVNDNVDTMRNNPEAMALAGQLFKAHCAGCHGAEGHGSKGVIDLTRGQYNYGTSAEAIRATIRDGRRSEMPGMGHDYGELELGEIVAFVETLATGQPLNDYEQHGREMYMTTCASCHGPEGKGQPALGAPSLADDYWINGDSMMNMRLAITRGVVAVCPAQGSDLTPIEIELLTAYTLDLLSR